MERIKANKERIAFLAEWIGELSKNETFENRNKIFELTNEMESRAYFNKMYIEHQQRMVDAPKQQLEMAKTNYHAAIKGLRETRAKEEQHYKAKNEILKRAAKGKIKEDQLMSDYGTAMGIINYYKANA
jgi:hypothetical protein